MGQVVEGKNKSFRKAGISQVSQGARALKNGIFHYGIGAKTETFSSD